ncbi:HEPN domain-containing protein [Synechococcus sp. CBW1004]|jgi:HEPN domain-containing protein|uniref:HEPN domain-containing protein n=1 Tax=Synechococcus sp. CBW1004 TaxID=1353136 RepID=UPI0018CE4B54|nr:HEPN domain-containing protein [Synechococcus sp. CBW1004]QPN62241.1 HEPN domain-containing protein [Synechococcus sp. CBW1004]
MSLESARHRARLWIRQAEDDLRAARLLQAAGQSAQACFLSQQVGEKAIKALLAAEDRDLRSHSLTALLRTLDEELAVRWQRQARVLDKLYAPTRYPDALGDELPADVFGPEDGEAALQAAGELLDWASQQLQ